MANHIVRPDTRGNLTVISKTPTGVRISVPFTLPQQAFDHCQRECKADRIIDDEAALQAAVDDQIEDLWFAHFAGHGGI